MYLVAVRRSRPSAVQSDASVTGKGDEMGQESGRDGAGCVAGDEAGGAQAGCAQTGGRGDRCAFLSSRTSLAFFNVGSSGLDSVRSPGRPWRRLWASTMVMGSSDQSLRPLADMHAEPRCVILVRSRALARLSSGALTRLVSTIPVGTSNKTCALSSIARSYSHTAH